MKNPVIVSTDAKNPSNDTPHQIEDAALKITMQYFADELLFRSRYAHSWVAIFRKSNEF